MIGLPICEGLFLLEVVPVTTFVYSRHVSMLDEQEGMVSTFTTLEY